MEFIVMDSSVLITSCLFWKYEKGGRKIFLRQRKFSECEALFELVKANQKDIKCIITKTVEIEATIALKKTIDSFIRTNMRSIPDLMKKYGYETLKNIIKDQSLDRLEDTIEEYSTRVPMDKKVVEKIIREEVDKFFEMNMPNTVRYFPLPPIIKRMKGTMDGKREIIRESLHSFSRGRQILYLTGEPREKDKRIMAEATYICRCHNDGKRVYVASLDYHFIPNPTQFDSYLSSLCVKDYEKPDSGMRDLLSEKFGFFSDRPKELLRIFNEMGFS